ncbi:MAG: glutathione ABC transporter substrate-binding protein [Trueperaceae bacterium]|nr:glutathione ABC transporter substrate-binding protein [Trueperaceae bacterium]
MSNVLSRLLLSFTLCATLLSVAFAQDTLIIAQGTDAVTLDAHAITDSPSATVSSHIVETLFELTPEGNIEPRLAESFTVSDDGLVWTLDLREDVMFHDGTPFNAEAVKYNLDRFLDPELGFTFRFLLARIEQVDVVDEYTVQLTLSDSFAPLLAHMTHSSTAMQSPAAIEEFGEDYGENPVGTGPFSLETWNRGERIDLVRNDDYWGTLPGVAAVSFLAVPENTTRMALVETGEAHVAVRVPPQDIARLNAAEGLSVENVSSVRTIYIYFNHLLEPFTDVRVRQAVNYAVDKELIAEFVLGGAVRPSDAPVAPGIFGYTPVGYYEYDPELARQLLADAGYPDGFSTTLYSPSGRYLQDIQTAEAIQSQLAEVGIDASIETLEWSSYLALTREAPEDNTVPMALLGWGTVTGDADYGLFPLFHTSEWVPDGSNRAFYSNPEVDALLDEARTVQDEELRLSLYEDAMQTIWDEAAWLFLHSETQLVAVRDEVQGLVIHPTERVLALNASLE